MSRFTQSVANTLWVYVMGVCDDGAESGGAFHGASGGALESEIIGWKNKAITRLTI